VQSSKFVAGVLAGLMLLSATAALASPSTTVPDGRVAIGSQTAAPDPIEGLQARKECIRERLSAGKISQDRATKLLQHIDAKIAELQAFNQLTPAQKKTKLIIDFTARINAKVKEGKITRDKADQAIAQFTAKVKSWDGQGYPPFGNEGFGQGHRHPRHPKGKVTDGDNNA